jgi:hypothetical protein
MKILELNFWKDFNEKYLNFSVKYRSKIPKLDFGIILVKMWLKFSSRKILRFLLFLFKPGKKSEQSFQGRSSQAT